MDVSKLSIRFLKGYTGDSLPDGYTQTDKRLPYFSVACPLEGFYELGIEDGPLQTVPQGGCFLVPPLVRHTLVHRCSGDRFSDRWLYFSVLFHDVLDVTAWFQPPHILASDEALPFRQILDELVNLPAEPYAKAFRQMQIAGKLLEVLDQVSNFYPTALHLERIYPAIELIGDRFAEHLTVDDMAKLCGMSATAFYRAFHETTKKTPMQYLTEHRLKYAAQLLMAERTTLAVIASQCGFYDEFHLSRTFKSYYGVSPREYKKRSSGRAFV